MYFYKISNVLDNLDKVIIITEEITKKKTMKIKAHPQWKFSWTLRASIIFFKFIGLATFAHCIVIQKKKNHRVSLTLQYSKLGTFYNVILIILMIASNFLSIPYRVNMEYVNKTNLTEGIEILQTILGTIVICLILLNYCIDQKSLVKIANRLMDMEQELDHLYCPSLKRECVFRTSITVCLINSFLFVSLLTTEIYAFHSSPISWLSDILPTFHIGWFMIQYFLIITIIQADFVDINRAIRALSIISSPTVQPQSTLCQTRRIVVSNSTIHQLLQLRDVHCHLCDISEDVSEFYSLPILFGIAFMFFTLIYNGYYLLSPLLVSDEVLQYEIFTNTVVWLIFSCYPILLLTDRITQILKEMGKTGNVVHKVLGCTIGNEAKSELKQFSLQLLHRRIQFTASGYFKLDNTLFHSMIGAVTTYLVILVQFQMGSSCSSKLQCNCTQGELSRLSML